MDTEGRVARNYTGAFSLETRQHTLLGIDLGEGAPRKPLVFGLIAFALWIPLLWLVIGAPNRFTATLFILPPTLLTYFGSQKAPSNPRRFRFTTWVLAVSFMLRGHRPIIALGRRQPTRAELTPWRERREEFPWTRRAAWERPLADQSPHVPPGKPVHLTIKARLFGNAYMAGVLRRRNARRKGKPAS